MPIHTMREALREIAGGVLVACTAHVCAPRFGFDQKTAGMVALACCVAHTVSRPLFDAVKWSLPVSTTPKSWKNVVHGIGLAVIGGAHPLAAVTVAQYVAARKEISISISWGECCAIGSVAFYAKSVYVVTIGRMLL